MVEPQNTIRVVSHGPVDDNLDSDEELMRRVQAGEAVVFGRIVERYQRPLLRVAASRLGRRDWAQDAVQETFLAAFKGRHTYRREYSFRTWLWTILLNECRRLAGQLRRAPIGLGGAARGLGESNTRSADRAQHDRVSSWSDEAALDEHCVASDADQADGGAPLGRLLAAERRNLLEQALASLPQTQADALRLRFFGELKFQEIADALGCSLGTAKNRVRVGLLRLAELVGRD